MNTTIISNVVHSHSVRTSFTVGGILAALSVASDLPWPIWAAWGGLTVIAVVQAARK